LRIPQESGFVGTWELTQAINWNNGQQGGENPCNACDDEGSRTPTDYGFGEAADNLYIQRLDGITFSEDENGTFSFQTKGFCAFSRVHDWGDNACQQRFILIDGHFVSHETTENGAPQGNYFDANLVSDTTAVISVIYPAATNYNMIRLDKSAAPLRTFFNA
jgi:hypothetical protein